MSNPNILEFIDFEINNLQKYSDQLADFLEINRTIVSSDEIEKLTELKKMISTLGQIGRLEVIFLFVFGITISAKSVVEIGTASGMSGLVLANALFFQKLKNPTQNIRFKTIDIRSYFSLEEKKMIRLLRDLAGMALSMFLIIGPVRK